ncbi:MAG: transglycosylase domain-containing protein [Nitriliruptorales bacterium]|nr:transglycosylase domain-containing protein [Nitriliruptorales bacterium]
MSDSRLGALLLRLVLLVLVVAGTGALAGTLFLPTAMAVTDVVSAVERDVFDVPALPDAEVPPENSFIYAADGSELAEINKDESRIPVTLAQVPEVTINAIIATEDATFWSHNGVNHRAILRAAFANLRAGDIEQGGSTITQQLIKNAYIGIENADQSYDRKIREALWAIELEKRMPKDEILERYLNRAYFGNGVYGVGKAAERYFSKTIEELDLTESALIAGLIRTPEGNNPLRNPDAAQARRDIVLGQMAINGYITRAQADAAMTVDVVDMLNPKAPEPSDEPWFVDYVTRLLYDETVAESIGTHVDALDAMGVTKQDRIRTVFQGGLRIHTTLDPELQELAYAAIRDHLLTDEPTPEEIAQAPLGGIVSVEPGTGAVRTLALGPREYGSCLEDVTDLSEIPVDDNGRLLCHKTKTNPLVPEMGTGFGRQPGSSFKPFVITAALEKGLPPGWQVESSGPATIPGCDNGGPWEVNNSGGNGIRDMYTGVKASSNVFHAKLVKEVGPEKARAVAERLGIKNGNLPAECAIALGAADVFPVEMAAAYATLAARGEYCPPAFITRIEDREGNLLYEHTPDCEQVVDTDVADRVVDIMKGPVTAGGTASFMQGKLGNYPVRGKTGTTQDYRDAWFVGYVKQLATAAWVGYDSVVVYDCDRSAGERCDEAQFTRDCFGVDPATNTRRCNEPRFLRNVTIAGQYRDRVFGGTIPAPMWGDYMVEAVQRFEPESWPSPGALPMATVPDLLQATSIAEAEEIAEAAKLHLETEEVDHWEPAGTFVGQTPEPGTKVPAGRLVILQVSNGEGEAPAVPNVVGLTREEAEKVLIEAGYEVKVVTEETSVKKDDGLVIEQSPQAGENLAPGDGAAVVIKVGAYVEPEPEPQPSPTLDDPLPGDDDGGGGPGNGGGNGGGNNP